MAAVMLKVHGIHFNKYLFIVPGQSNCTSRQKCARLNTMRKMCEKQPHKKVSSFPIRHHKSFPFDFITHIRYTTQKLYFPPFIPIEWHLLWEQ